MCRMIVLHVEKNKNYIRKHIRKQTLMDASCITVVAWKTDMNIPPHLRTERYFTIWLIFIIVRQIYFM